MNRRSIYALLVLAACGSTVSAPRDARAWQNVITSDDGDGGGRRTAFTANGDVIAVGTLDIGSADFQQILVARLTGATGSELWRRAIHGTATTGFFGTLNSPTSAAVDGAGNVVLTGIVDNSIFSDANIMFYVGKLDGGDGHELWRQEIAEGFATTGVLDSLGNAVAVGYKDVGAGGSSGFATKRASATGSELWSKELRGTATFSNFNDLYAVAIDPFGDVIVAGEVHNATRDFFVAKLAANTGTELWRKEIDGAAHEEDAASAVAVDSLGNVFAVGAVSNASSNGSDFLLVKLAAANGGELWRKQFTGNRNLARAQSVAVDGADDVVVGGWIFNSGDSVSLVIKYDGTTGDEAWRHQESNGPGGSSFAFAQVDDADDVVAEIAVGTDGDDAVMHLSGADGAEASRQVFPTKKKVFIGSFAIDDDGSLAIAASVQGRSSSGMATIKLGAEAAGKKILVQDKSGDATKRKVQVQVKDTQFVAGSPGGSLDPRVVGATLTVKNPTTAETATMALPAANWKGSGNPAGSKGYKYTDKKPLEGPCISAQIKNGQWQATCAGSQISFTLDEASQGSLGAKLSLGTSSSCALFGGTIKKDVPAMGTKPGVFQAQDAPAPGACP